MTVESLADCLARNDSAEEGTENYHWYEPVQNYSTGLNGLVDGKVVVVATSIASALQGLGEVMNWPENRDMATSLVNGMRDPRDLSRSEQRASIALEHYYDSDHGCYLIRATLWWEDEAVGRATR